VTQQRSLSYAIKKYFPLFGSFYLFIFLTSSAFAQDEVEIPHGQWSVAVYSGGAYSVSSSMHGDIGQYEAALASGTTPAQYPFGTYMAFTVGFGAQFDYRFSKSPWSFFAGSYGSSYNAGHGFGGGRFTMTILSGEGGIEYTSGQTYQEWNFYGRLGLVPSVIAAQNRASGGNRFSFDSLRINSIDSRLGMEVEIGERYHFPRTPIGIEASINYTNVNFFGKSYSVPTYGAFYGRSGSINDGKNPNDPNDSPRTIDFLSLRLGARFYF
jgi:hypothetical protein